MIWLILLSCQKGEQDSTDSAEEFLSPDTGVCQQIDYLPSWQGWAQGFFLTWCTSCHSEAASERYGAPVGVDFDTEEQVRTQAALIHWVVLEEESMPKGGGLYEEDQALLDVYLSCGL